MAKKNSVPSYLICLQKVTGIATKARKHQSVQKIFCAILCFSAFVAEKKLRASVSNYFWCVSPGFLLPKTSTTRIIFKFDSLEYIQQPYSSPFMDHRAGRQPSNNKAQNTAASAGMTYLLGIGINTYEHWGNLNNAVRDVEAIANILQQNYGVTLWKLLRNEEATRKQILRDLKALMKEVKAPDSIIIYYAGHGHIDKDTQLGAWVPTDGENEDTDLYIPNSTLRDFFQVAKAQHVFFISDACFSGSLLQERRSAAEEMVLTELAARPSRWVMCSGRHDEAVADGPLGGHSPFAQAIIDELTYNQKTGLNAAALAQKVQLQSKQYYKDQLSDYGPVFGTGDMRGQLVLWREGAPITVPSPEKNLADHEEFLPSQTEMNFNRNRRMTLNDFRETVAHFLAEDDAKGALEFMNKALREENSDQNAIVLLLSRVSRVRKQEDGGTINQNDAATERNRINASIRNVANGIDADDLRDDFFFEKQQQPNAPARMSEEEVKGLERAIALKIRIINALREKLVLEDDPIRLIRYEEQLQKTEEELQDLKDKLHQ